MVLEHDVEEVEMLGFPESPGRELRRRLEVVFPDCQELDLQWNATSLRSHY